MATGSRAYTLLARFYDQLSPFAPAMNRRARRRILGPLLSRIRSVCDLGCGSGATALEFARRGRRVFAVDNSPEFCRIVRRKARRQRLAVRVLCADMRRFRLPEPVDLVTCEFAALNNVPRRADLADVCRAVARALKPGGRFLFDINTRKAFAEQTPGTHWFERRRFKLVMRGRWEPQQSRAVLEFDWFIPRGRFWRHARERVPHVCWSDAEIRRALRRAGFRRIRVYDGADVRSAKTTAGRGFDMYYLAHKP